MAVRFLLLWASQEQVGGRRFQAARAFQARQIGLFYS